MIDNKFKTPFIALIGAVALMVSAPAFAQAPAPATEAAASAAVATADASSGRGATGGRPGGGLQRAPIRRRRGHQP